MKKGWPQVSAQRKLASELHNAPRMVAQRRQLQQMFGHTAQLMESPENEEEPLQTRFTPFQGMARDDKPSSVLQAVFSQNPAAGIQHSTHGGVKLDYDTANNLIEAHILAGANNNGQLMPNFLTALWEARDTIMAGQARAPGGVFMRPGGSQVLKVTMEMLGEAIGQGPALGHARRSKTGRKAAAIPMWVDPTGAGRHDDILDAWLYPNTWHTGIHWSDFRESK